MAEKWIQGAIKRPGAFKAKAKAAGKGTQAYARSVLKEGSKASTRTQRQAALAQTLSKLRSGKAKFLVPLVLLAATAAHAATKTCPSGTLAPAPITATGPTTDIVIARAAPALVMQASGTGTATVVMEMSCDGTNWAQVTNSSMSVPPSQVVSVLQPTCSYRANVTACTTCSITVVYACSGA